MNFPVMIATINGHRCPNCGRRLKRTPDSYYCFKCRTHFPHGDIDVEVVE